ncbi:Aste57867_1777 [Aphanomyces stellatus]|uniref:Aste57867_1777 protein n=2 Tax=Aphanomyces stellatus TaxID=120398 RepID=A0A485K9H8_9STRA|nr:hypothetical protein As57867_001775 [Aphanomyces stellatus]VFT78986.1 Aste57867_1777 [Aphanomyces stellatus]
MGPFVRLFRCVNWPYYFQHKYIQPTTKLWLWSEFTDIAGCLDTWLCYRSIEDVPLLVKYLPWLRDILITVAIHRESRPLARAVDISRCHTLVIQAGVQQACQVGSVPLLKHFYPHHTMPWVSDDNDAMDCAAANGNLEIIQVLHSHRSEDCTTFAMNYAAARGHLGVVQYLHQHRAEVCTTNAIDRAASNGHMKVVQFLHQHRSEGCTTNAMVDAANNGHLKIVQFLHEHRTEGCTIDAIDYTAFQGNLEVVQYLHQNDAEGCTKNAMDYAALRGHLEVLQRLNANRTEGCTPRAMEYALRPERAYGNRPLVTGGVWIQYPVQDQAYISIVRSTEGTRHIA